MTLTEILKGLDICQTTDCPKCPYFGVECCVQVLLEDAADMLRIQRKDIDVYREYISQGKNIKCRSEGI